MTKQPDFNKLFFDYFGRKTKKVTYELRLPPNLLHDLVFMSSLVHDARFHIKDIVIRGKKLTIPIERDCWELPKMPETNELHVTRSRLVFTTVHDIRWEFKDISKASPDKELWIDYLYIDEDFRSDKSDYFTFTIAGDDWKLIFSLKEYDFTAKLQDEEAPYLYSERYK